jgi:hypothetical protein
MGITFKAFGTVLGNEVALKLIDTLIAAHPEARELSCAKHARCAAPAPERCLGLLLRDTQEESSDVEAER